MGRPPTPLEFLGLHDPLSDTRMVGEEGETVGELRKRLARISHPPEVTKIYLFGSRARGDWTKDSDFDFYVRFQTDNTRGMMVIKETPEELKKLYMKKREIEEYYDKEIGKIITDVDYDIIVSWLNPIQWWLENSYMLIDNDFVFPHIELWCKSDTQIDVGEYIKKRVGRSPAFICEYVWEWIENWANYAFVTDEEFTPISMGIYGSFVKQQDRPESDIDIVLEYEGEYREDSLFNAWHGEDQPKIRAKNGKEWVVDINPIKEDRTGSMQEFMKTHKVYLCKQR